MGQQWPTIVILIVNTIYICAISWKYILNKLLVKICNETINISDLLNTSVIKFQNFVFLNLNINPFIVRSYYKIYNQQITKVIIFIPWEYIFIMSRNFRDYTHTLFNYFKINFKYFLIYIKISIYFFIKLYDKILKLSDSISDFNMQFDELLSDKIKILDNHNNEISLKFKQWFAGITDGDGYIYVNKKGNVCFELTLPSEDEKVLRIIQNKFGGNIHLRAGVKAIRYRNQRKENIIKIIHCLNGLIINNIRLRQLHKACQTLNIKIKNPILPDINSAYISGLLDSDGTINFYKHNYNDTYRYQLTISICNKSRVNIEFLLKVIGGQIYYDKSDNGCYLWKANSKLLHLILYDYFLKFPPKTIKKHRTYLIKEFHDLNEVKMYRETDVLSVKYKIWNKFNKKWNNKTN